MSVDGTFTHSKSTKETLYRQYRYRRSQGKKHGLRHETLRRGGHSTKRNIPLRKRRQVLHRQHSSHYGGSSHHYGIHGSVSFATVTELPASRTIRLCGTPLIMRKYASVTLRKAKTDKIDAIKIANYGLEQWHSLQEYQPREATYAELKTLGRKYYFYLKMRVDALNNLTDLLDQTMPNIKSLLQNTNAKKTKSKLCDFVSVFWHYDCITAMSEKRFCTAYARWAKKEGYRPDETKAKAIFALARSGIPIMPSEVPSTKMLVLESVRVLTEVDQTLSVILARIQPTAEFQSAALLCCARRATRL